MHWSQILLPANEELRAFCIMVFAFGVGAGIVSLIFGGLSIAAIKMSRSSWM
jgi:hypothetical protein